MTNPFKKWPGKSLITSWVALFFVGLTMAACDDGVFTTPTTNELMTPTHNYEIDTWGANSEIYEFTPKSHDGKVCVMLMLDNGNAMGLQCFDKKK